MPALVVDPLEVVEIEQRERDVGLRPRGPLEQRVDVLVERPPVLQARERVTARLGEGQREPALVRQRRRGQVGDRCRELGVDLEMDVERHGDEQRAEDLGAVEERHGERLSDR